MRWWVILSLVAALAGVPGFGAARLLAHEITSASEQAKAIELDSVGGASVQASCGNGAGASVMVSWKGGASALMDGFEILRRDTGGKFLSVGVVSAAGSGQFSDDTVAPGGSYTYAVRAVNNAWNGDRSATVPVTIPSCA